MHCHGDVHDYTNVCFTFIWHKQLMTEKRKELRGEGGAWRRRHFPQNLLAESRDFELASPSALSLRRKKCLHAGGVVVVDCLLVGGGGGPSTESPPTRSPPLPSLGRATNFIAKSAKAAGLDVT